MPQDIIKIENVYYSYPDINRAPQTEGAQKKWALENISLSVKEGEFLAVMGKNGSGKTSFCRLFNGAVPSLYGGRFSGTVTVDGLRTDKTPVPLLALKAGMVFDDPDAQLFTSSVRREAAFGPENLLLAPEEIKQRVEFALSSTGLRGFEERQPSTLSGGEKQRLVIAAALAMNGKIIVLDEPLSRLDTQGVDEVMSVLKELRLKYQITVIMASHNSAKMAEFADRVCILGEGRVIACDCADSIFANTALLDENGIQPPRGADIHDVFTADSVSLPDEKEAVGIKNLCFSYGKDNARIDNINLSIKDNDFVAIIGRNGCGKTTLLKNITGLLRPCCGDIFIRGKNTKEMTVSSISKEAGFVMQNPQYQLFTDSVFNEISFALKNSGLAEDEINKRVQDAIDTAGLKDRDAFPHALSAAERTKTVIASVLAMGCKIVIFDEADTGQDYPGQTRIMNIARELHSKGFTVIFVTHSMHLTCEYAHRLILMDKNGIVMDRRRMNRHEE